MAVFEQTEQEHDKHLHQLMETAEKHGLVFNSKKCFIKQKQISLYGMIFSGEGIQPDPKKVSDIHNMPTPTSKRELQEFLGPVPINFHPESLREGSTFEQTVQN